MATAVETGIRVDDHRVSFFASWSDYEAIAQAIGDQHVRIAYDGKKVELMSPGYYHDDFASLVEMIVRAICDALDVDCKSTRTSRMERADVARAIEGDATFYFDIEKIAVARRRPRESSEWPLPDLAIEIDISRSKVDRPGVYAALGVPELWRFDGETLHIERLGTDQIYSEVEESGWLGVRPAEVAELLAIDARGDNDFTNKVRDWARNVLVPRRRNAD